ncbi:Uncharacterised protein [Streptococcus pneumoniae]|nr:Uncharacterised protein [Streptococcus pneumoniae]
MFKSLVFLFDLVALIFQGQVFYLLHESVHFLRIFYIEACCTDLSFTIAQKGLATVIVCKDLIFTEVRRQACEFLLFFTRKDADNLKLYCLSFSRFRLTSIQANLVMKRKTVLLSQFFVDKDFLGIPFLKVSPFF